MTRKKKVSRPIFCGKQNIAGLNIKKARKEKHPGMSQNDLAVKMQLNGIPMNKNKVQKVEAGLCGISDIELVSFAKVLQTTVDELLDTSIYDSLLYTQNETNGEKAIASSNTPYDSISYTEPEDKL